MKLKAFIEALLAKGRLSFDREEAVAALGVGPDAMIASARRAQSAGILLHPRRGFFVIVPPQARVFGAPPVNQIIDPLMKYEGARYYVGLLKAAEVHGAAHQAVMEFQVVCNKRLPEIDVGRSVIRPFFRKEWPDAALLEKKTTDTGTYLVSGATLTAFDAVPLSRCGGDARRRGDGDRRTRRADRRKADRCGAGQRRATGGATAGPHPRSRGTDASRRSDSAGDEVRLPVERFRSARRRYATGRYRRTVEAEDPQAAGDRS